MLSDLHVVTDPFVLIERVKSSFQGLGYPQLANVQCEAEASTIYLSGKLTSYYLKQIAQTIAIKVPGIRHVVNDIKVVSEVEFRSAKVDGAKP